MEHNKLSLKALNRLSISDYKKTKKLPIIIVLDNIRSMSNIGSIFRTSDAFKIECIYLCGITSKPPHREIRKTALGATESVDWKYFGNTLDAIKALKEAQYSIISIEQVENSTMLQDFKTTKGQKLALVMGNEVTGVDQVVIDESVECVEIPQYGTKHSLNVSVSASLILWHLLQKDYL